MAQGALVTLPPCRFTISKRGLRGLAGESETFHKQWSASKAVADTDILPHRHDFEKCFERTSADLAQVGRCNPNPYLLGEEFNQHHDPTLAIDHLVDAFDTRKWSFCEAHALA